MVFGPNAKAKLDTARQKRGATGVRTQLDAEGLTSAVSGVEFSVHSGELFVIMGLSGSGKSTLVRCLSRLIEPTSGHVEMDGEDILAASDQRLLELRRTKMGMVFQHFGLFPHMTVADNVAFPLKMQGVALRERTERAAQVIELVGLQSFESRYPRELSGGQRQRVGIARSLASNPELWFLDEPFSALDPLIRRQLQDEFLRLQETLHKTIVFITHDFAEALRIADRIAIMRDGEFVQVGTANEIVISPADEYVANFARDIPKANLMTVGELMTSSDSTPAATSKLGPRLCPEMPLEEVLLLCANNFSALPVEDSAGNVVGMVTPDRIVQALRRS